MEKQTFQFMLDSRSESTASLRSSQGAILLLMLLTQGKFTSSAHAVYVKNRSTILVLHTATSSSRWLSEALPVISIRPDPTSDCCSPGSGHLAELSHPPHPPPLHPLLLSLNASHKKRASSTRSSPLLLLTLGPIPHLPY